MQGKGKGKENMYYLPLSIKAEESARFHRSYGEDNILFVCKNIVKAIEYTGSDNELTNWAKSNTLNMLHLLRFLDYSICNYQSIASIELFIPEESLSILGAVSCDYDVSSSLNDDGFITFKLNEKIITMNVKVASKKRDSFITIMPIPISSENLKNNIVWYNRLYCKVFLQKVDDNFTETAEDIYVTYGSKRSRFSGEKKSVRDAYEAEIIKRFKERTKKINKQKIEHLGMYDGWEENVTIEDESEFIDSLTEIITQHEEIL